MSRVTQEATEVENNAIKAMKGGRSIKKTGEEYDIPRRESVRLSSLVPYLNQEEEGDIANFHEVLSSIGYVRKGNGLRKILLKTAVHEKDIFHQIIV